MHTDASHEDVLVKYPELVDSAEKLLALAKKNYPQPEFKRIKEAMETILVLHANQGSRPGGDTYMAHILAVTQRVLVHEPPVDSDVVIASLFHDTIEDVPTRLVGEDVDTASKAELEERGLALLRSAYGERVARIVQAVTNPDFDGILAARGIDRDNSAYRPEKNILYAEHVMVAIKDHDALAVKIADLAENAASLNEIPYQTEAHEELRQFLAAKYLPVVEHAVELLQSLDRYPTYQQDFRQAIISLKKILGQNKALAKAKYTIY